MVPPPARNQHKAEGHATGESGDGYVSGGTDLGGGGADVRGSPRKRGKKRPGVRVSRSMESLAGGGEASVAEGAELRRSTEILQEIEREEERLQTALSDLQAAKELVETSRLSSAQPPLEHAGGAPLASQHQRHPSTRYDEHEPHEPSYGDNYDPGYGGYDGYGSGGGGGSGRYGSGSGGGGSGYRDGGYDNGSNSAHGLGHDGEHGKGGGVNEEGYDGARDGAPISLASLPPASAAAGEPLGEQSAASFEEPRLEAGLHGAGHDAPPQLHVAVALEAAAAAVQAAVAVALAVPWSDEPAPFQQPAAWTDEGGTYGEEGGAYGEAEAHAQAEGDALVAAEEAAALAVAAASAADAEEVERIMAARAEQQQHPHEEEGDVDGLLRVPSTFRLQPMPGYFGAQANVFSAADLPSPTASPARPSRRTGEAGGAQYMRTQPDINAGRDSEEWEYEVGREAGGEAGGDEADEEQDEYYDDDFETDEDGDVSAEEETPEEDEDAKLHATLQATMLSADRHDAQPQGASFGSYAVGRQSASIAQLEAELRSLQLQNDEQAVVHDEVNALSGTLRAVAAVLAVPHMSENTIHIHRPFTE